MTGYEQFVLSCPNLKPGKIARLWELEVRGRVGNMIDFCREFLAQQGFKFTGTVKDAGGEINAVFNGSFVWAGACQEGGKLAIRLIQM
jgi:hypothetical protein